MFHRLQSASPRPPPQLDEASLLLLLQLLRVNNPVTKTLLQRLLLNLVPYAPLNAAVMRLLLSALRGPLTFDEQGQEGADAGPLIGVQGEVCRCTAAVCCARCILCV